MHASVVILRLILHKFSKLTAVLSYTDECCTEKKNLLHYYIRIYVRAQCKYYQFG